jgi:hypothetical protein
MPQPNTHDPTLAYLFSLVVAVLMAVASAAGVLLCCPSWLGHVRSDGDSQLEGIYGGSG